MIALGTPVIYTHRAAVGRLGPFDVPEERRTWRLTEGVRKNAYVTDLFVREPELFIRHGKIYSPRRWGRKPVECNKTVFVWPEEGSGVVVGLIRRQKGISHRGGGYGEDWEPGYFDPVETFELYVVRWELRGQDYILVPPFAIQPFHVNGNDSA